MVAFVPGFKNKYTIFLKINTLTAKKIQYWQQHFVFPERLFFVEKYFLFFGNSITRIPGKILSF